MKGWKICSYVGMEQNRLQHGIDKNKYIFIVWLKYDL